MTTPLPSPKSIVNCKPMTIEDVKNVVQKKGIISKVGMKKKLTQNVNEFIQEIVSSSTKNSNFEGLISLRMLNTSGESELHTSRDGKHMYHDTRTLISRIQESFEDFDAGFVNKSSANFDSYLNGISFTLFVKSFVLIFDHGHRPDARKFFNKNADKYKIPGFVSNNSIDVKPIIENGCPQVKPTAKGVIERQRMIIESMESSLASNLLDASLVSFNRSKIFIPIPSELKQQLKSYLEESKDQILNRLFNESMILVEIQDRTQKLVPQKITSFSSSDGANKRRKKSFAAKDGEEAEEYPLKKKIKKEPGIEDEEEGDASSENQKIISDPTPSLIPSFTISVCVCTIGSTSNSSNTSERTSKTSPGNERATCAAISGDKSLVVAGFETSNCIKIFPMKVTSKYQNLYKSEERKSSKSHLRLNIDADAFKSCFYDEVDDQESSNRSNEGDNYSNCWKNGDAEKCLILRGHSKAVTSLSFVKNFGAKNESNFLLSASKDSTVRLWNVSKSSASAAIYSTGELYNHSIWTIDSDNLGVYFASGSSDTIAKLWSIGSSSGPLRLFVGHKLDINCIKFHPNCKYLASGSSDATIKLWSLNDAKCVRSMSTNVSSNVSKSCTSSFFNPIITSICFAPNGHQLASGGSDGAVKLWDLRMSNRVLKSFKSCALGGQSPGVKDNDLINHVNFNSDGSLISSTSIDGSIKVWSVDGVKDTIGTVETESSDNQMQTIQSSTPISSFSVRKNGVSLLSSSFVKSSSSPCRNLLIAFASSS